MKQKTIKRLRAELPLHIMLIPGIIVTLIFAYFPMVGIVMAFEKYNPVLGFFGSKWVGMKNFNYIFAMPEFYQVLFNTLYIAVQKIILGILVPLTIALLLNEVTKNFFKRFVQTSIFVPFFLSWAILGGVVFEIFSYSGVVNGMLSAIGIKPIMFLGDKQWFRTMLVVTDVWKGMGYNVIIFLAAITNIDTSLYEAAEVDGAGKWRQALSLTLPGILPIVILISTLSIGSILNAGFEQVLILYNPIVYESSDIIDTFVYRMGIFNQQLAPAAAVGLFKSSVSLVLVSISYYLAYKFSDYRIF